MRTIVLSLSFLLLVSCQIKTQDESRPNIIFILADDLGAGDLHVTGHPYAQTPNLDKLASNGVRFEKAYMAAAWCAPSRYGLMSGQYPAREFNETKNLNPKQPSITAVLNDAGYATAHFGKWHLTTEDSKYAKNPSEFGIDSFFLNKWNGDKIAETWSKEEKGKEYWRAHSTNYFVDMAIDFIEKNNANKVAKPYYMNLWIYPTHSYIHPTPEQLAVYGDLKVNYNDFSEHQQSFLKFVAEHGDIDKAMQAYCADITAMDKALGRLFDFLKHKGLDKNTLIVFTSDNGPGPLTTQVNSGSVIKRYKELPDLLNSVGSAKNYKERKVSQNEGGIRVPFIVNWPGKINKGFVDKTSNIQGVDWLPTIAAISGTELPEGIYDGMDVTSAFMAEGLERDKPLFWAEKDQAAILIDNMKGYLKGDRFELFDIESDPSQSADLSEQNPKLAVSMKQDLNNWLKNVSKN